MSISISIGSNVEDINNIHKTLDVLKFVSNLLKSEDQEAIFAEKTYTKTQIDELYDWYRDILFILHHAGTSEEEILPSN